MAIPLQPQLRSIEILPLGTGERLLFALRDPEGFGRSLNVPYGTVILAMLMDGRRTLLEIQSEFQSQTGVQAPLDKLEAIVRELDNAYLLASDRFDQYRREQVDGYLKDPVRPASHAGAAYADRPQALREQLGATFTCEQGPGAVDRDADARGQELCGIVSPHIDLHRGGPVFAWAYKQVVQRCDAELFVIFGTAHHPMEELFCVSRKDFDTPLGVVRTDRRFVDRLAEHLGSSTTGRQIDLFQDELVHRVEHSIEIQTVFLQYLLGGNRQFRIVAVLVGSFEEFLSDGALPDESLEFQAFLAAMRDVAAECSDKICYIAAADFAHIGQHFGDEWLLDEQRLAEQARDDRELLEAACRCDSAAFFRHVGAQADRSRICGLSPTYTMLQVMGPMRGELLKYDQAVEPDGTACVSFASVAYYREREGG